MPNHPWADPTLLSLHGKLLRTANSSGTCPFQWGDASPGTLELWPRITATCAGWCTTKLGLAGFSDTAFAPDLRVSDAPWSQSIAVHKPLI